MPSREGSRIDVSSSDADVGDQREGDDVEESGVFRARAGRDRGSSGVVPSLAIEFDMIEGTRVADAPWLDEVLVGGTWEELYERAMKARRER